MRIVRILKSRDPLSQLISRLLILAAIILMVRMDYSWQPRTAAPIQDDLGIIVTAMR